MSARRDRHPRESDSVVERQRELCIHAGTYQHIERTATRFVLEFSCHFTFSFFVGAASRSLMLMLAKFMAALV
jgi:hypothetical protein